MKLLMIYTTKFSYNPTIKTIDSMPDVNEGKEYENVQTAFIQVEEEDLDKESEVKKSTILLKKSSLYLQAAARSYHSH